MVWLDWPGSPRSGNPAGETDGSGRLVQRRDPTCIPKGLPKLSISEM